MAGTHSPKDIIKMNAAYGLYYTYRNSGRSGWYIHCKCGASQTIGRPINCIPEHLVPAFKREGWDISLKYPPVCAQCQKGERKVTSTSVAPNPKIARQIYASLDDHFNEKKRVYNSGWSDAKIAKELDVSVSVVTAIRKEAYGELAEDPAITAFKEDIELLKLEFADQFAKLSSSFMARLSTLESQIPKTGVAK